MNEAQFEDKLNELVKEFGGAAGLQYRKLTMLAEQAGKDREESGQTPPANDGTIDSGTRKSIGELLELLDYVRICIKYQRFDLEATRRENEYLRKIIEG